MPKTRQDSEPAHVVALSGGKDSTALALRMRDVWPDLPVRYVCTPTGDELPDMLDHWRRLGDLLGAPILPVTSGTSLQGLIRRWRALPNPHQRWCTRVLKLEPYYRYLASPSLRWGRAPGDFARLDVGYHSADDRRRAVKTGACQRLSKRQRAATPPEFRDLLLSLARQEI